jgi:hypothetical protein
VELIVRTVGESETWLRLFDGKPIVTIQRESVSGLLAERFGPLEFRFRLSFAGHTIHYQQVGVILRLALPFFPEIPLPRWASPYVSARETAAEKSQSNTPLPIANEEDFSPAMKELSN